MGSSISSTKIAISKIRKIMVGLEKTPRKRKGKGTKDDRTRARAFNSIREDGCVYQKFCLRGEAVAA